MVHLDIHYISDFCMPTIYNNWFTDLMEISVDPDELASQEASPLGSSLFYRYRIYQVYKRI